MRWLYPQFPKGHLPIMARMALQGLCVAATYGAIHDQLSHAISPEYFTKLKFRQFAWANLGWPPRVFASLIGMLATWWVGMVAGWLLGHAGLVELPEGERRRKMWRAFGIVAFGALAGGAIGLGVGVTEARGDLSGWSGWQLRLRIEDLPGFVVVARLHAGGYLGALIGLIAAIIYVRQQRPRPAASVGDNPR